MKIRRFFEKSKEWMKEIRAELKKVNWPTWRQVLRLTTVVILVMFAIGAILWGTDGLLSFVLSYIIKS